MQCREYLKTPGQRIKCAQGLPEQQDAGNRAGTENQERKLRVTFCQFAWADQELRMNKDDTHPLRIGRAFFSRILPGIRRLAALTRNPVPIGWIAEGRARGGPQSFGRSLLDVVGCWLLVVGYWLLRVGRVNRPRHARFAFASQFSGPTSRLPRKSRHFRRTQTFGPACRLSRRFEPSAALRSRQI